MKLGLLAVLWCAVASADEATLRSLDVDVVMPQVVALDEAGNLYLASLFGPVYRVGSDGVVRTVIDCRWECGQWSGIAVDAAGSVYLSDFGRREVSRFDADGTRTLLADRNDVSQPSGLALDGAGNLYIADSGYRRVWVVRPDSRVDVVGEGIRAVAVTADRAGNLYVAAFPDRIWKIAADGTKTVIADGREIAEMPLAIAAASEGLVYFTDFWRVRAIGPDGVRTIAGFSDRYGFADDEFFGPTGLAVDGEGGLIVSDVVTGRVRKIEPAH